MLMLHFVVSFQNPLINRKWTVQTLNLKYRMTFFWNEKISSLDSEIVDFRILKKGKIIIPLQKVFIQNL
jgi:hypothetical protein